MMMIKTLKPQIFKEYYACNRIKALSSIDDVPDFEEFFEPAVGFLEEEYVYCEINGLDEEFCERLQNNLDIINGQGGSDTIISRDINKITGECEKFKISDFDKGCWYNYPKKIALVNTHEHFSTLQIYDGDEKLGCYIIEIQKDEIKRFFDENKDDLIVLENDIFARQIKPDYDSLIGFVESKKIIRKVKFRSNMLSRECRLRRLDLKKFASIAVEHQTEENFNQLVDVIEDYHVQVKKIEELFDLLEKEKMQDCIQTISDEEAYGVVFSLFYNRYLKCKDHKEFVKTVKAYLKTFIINHPESYEYFVDQLYKGEFDEEKFMKDFEDIMTDVAYYDPLADSILG
ncbi:MAG: hypothetical protein E7522_09485 [Ruminococcaceae bacterium]|nr:hypothetical protein [Oscillospiraceae bacterium]